MRVLRVLIVYDSRTGNTEKMAFAVLKGVEKVQGVAGEVKKVDDVELSDLVSADGIVFGSPTYYGDMSAKLKAVFDESFKVHGKLKGKVGGAFTSSGGTACGAETTLLAIIHAMLVHGMVVQGRPDNKHYGPAALEAPDDEAKEFCMELGSRVATLVMKLSG
jgi:NAD(P)H dehydrogenase (quinone)